MLEINKIYNISCLDGMQSIENQSIDCVITDLPYGTTRCHWDNVIPFEHLWRCYNRVCKPNAAIILFGTEPFTSNLILSNLSMFRQKLTYLKTRPTNVMNAKKQFMNWTEDICVFYKKLPTFNPQMRTDGLFTSSKVQHLVDRSSGVLGKTSEKEGYLHKGNNGLFYPKSVLEYSNVPSKYHFHPTQKPIELIRYLIRTYSNQGDLILDSCMGSGTTAIASILEDRRYIGFETNKEYYEKSLQLISNYE